MGGGVVKSGGGRWFGVQWSCGVVWRVVVVYFELVSLVVRVVK